MVHFLNLTVRISLFNMIKFMYLAVRSIKGKVLWQLAKKYDRFDHHIKALNFLISKLDEVVKSGSPVNGFKHLLLSFNNFLTNQILRTKILDGYQNVRKIKNNESDFSDILVRDPSQNPSKLPIFCVYLMLWLNTKKILAWLRTSIAMIAKVPQILNLRRNILRNTRHGN